MCEAAFKVEGCNRDMDLFLREFLPQVQDACIDVLQSLKDRQHVVAVRVEARFQGQ